jgi:hypothetical protein
LAYADLLGEKNIVRSLKSTADKKSSAEEYGVNSFLLFLCG